MFPPHIPHLFIRWLTNPGDIVYDPFSGRGTVALEAALGGRIAYASDANPMATILTGAKVDVPTRATAERRLRSLAAEYRPPDLSSVQDDVRMLYSDKTLARIVYLRNALNSAAATDRFLIATILGLLHANHSARGATRGFSISMPNTFAMSPGYVREYIRKHNLVRPDVDVFAMLEGRLGQLELPEQRVRAGRAWEQDATDPPPAWLRKQKVKLVFTSPPYLQVIKYAKYNWVRLWFLDEEPRAVDERLAATASLPRYREFMKQTLAGLDDVVRDNGFVCLVIGDVRRGDEQLNLAQDVWQTVAEPAGWQSHGVIADALPVTRKVSRIWKHNPGRATKTDRIVILSKSGRELELPPLARSNWVRRPAWQPAPAP